MRFSHLSILLTACMATGCAGGGSRAAPRGAGDPDTGGSGGISETPDSASHSTPDANRGLAPDAGTELTPDANSGLTPDTSTGLAPDADSAGAKDGATAILDSNTPMSVDGAAPPSYAGEIPIYYGPGVGPTVQMDCPGDPTQGWTEYRESFHIERPYNVPINTRFSIVGGIYNFWVFPPDFPHAPNAGGRNPRTEATYGCTQDIAAKITDNSIVSGICPFSKGQRMYSADMLIENNAVGSAIMQIHATANGGPVGLRIMSNSNMVNNGSLTVVNGSSVPGGLLGKWFNFKVSLDTSNVQVKVYINNCLKSTYDGSGARGNGQYYFKNGVYFCKTSKDGCFSHYKNLHFYQK